MKRKFSLFLNVAVLALCVCAIAIGVYSAKTASLNVSGTVGFTAHDCKVAVTGTIVGHSTTADGAPETTPQAITSVTVKDTQTLNLGTVYFSDMTASGAINPITLTLNFENLSDFDVEVNITPQTISGITITPDKTSVILSNKSATEAEKKKTVIVTLTCASDSTGITPAEKQILQVNMAKYTAPASGSLILSTASDFFWNNVSTNTRSYLTMGKYNEQDLRWYIFAKGDANGENMSAVTDAVETNSDNTLKAGTYWFISEYVLNYDKTIKDYGISFDDSSQKYSGSDIQLYLNNVSESATSTESFAKKYSFSAENNAVYKYLITSGGRNLPDETSYSVAGAFEGINNQYFWLLSLGELAYLNNNTEVAFYEYNANLIAQDMSATAQRWWLRSPCSAGGSDIVLVVDPNDGVGTASSCETFGVRPAFQITIAG